MKKAMFIVFTVVYVATAVATLVAFLAQARIIPSSLAHGETIPHLRLLISAVLVESVGGYLALAKNLFGLRSPDSAAEQEIKSLTQTSMMILSRLQALAYRYSSEFQTTIEELPDSLVDGLLAPFGLRTISERNKRILEITKNLEEALVKADEILSVGDKNEIKKVDRQLRSYLPTLEGWLRE